MTNLISPLPSTIPDPFPPVLAPPPTSLALLPTTGLQPSLPLVHALLSPFFRFFLLQPFWEAAGSEEEEDEIGNEKVGAEAEAGTEAV